MTEARRPMSPPLAPLSPVMRLSRWSLSVVTSALLMACASPTPYQRPEVSLPPSWQADPGTPVPTALPPIAWTALYTDERLQALIRSALERNHDLRLALARMEEARALWGVQRADQMPNVGLGASHTSARTPALVQGNAGAINTRRYDVGLNLLSFELDVWGRVASLSEAARLNFEASAEDRRTIRLGLINDVANAYYAQLEAEQRLSLLSQSERTREQVLELTRRKRDVGAASDLDVALAQAAWSNARSERTAMRRQAEQAQTALALLVGGQWPSKLPVGLPLALQNLDLRWDRDLPSEVLLQRPDVRAVEQRLMAAHANIHAARVAFLPRLQLTGLVGSASPAFSNLMGGGSSAWSFVPSLQQPIFDGGRVDAGVDLAQARQNQWVVSYEKTLQQAFREVADLMVARETLREQVLAQQAALDNQRERLRLTELRQQSGAASLIEWLDAQRDALATEQAVVQTQRLWLSASAQLFKALGGGDN